MRKLLIIEDDQIIANIYRNKFCQEGFDVELALDGEKGLEALPRYKPDLVIVDLVMPGLSGVEVIRRIRCMPGHAEVPIVVFSNTYLARNVQEAWQAGATKCLSKTSCTPREVIEIVRKTLNPLAASTATKPVSGPAAGGAKQAPPKTDAETQDHLRRKLLESLPEVGAALRTELQSVSKTDSQILRQKHLAELYRLLHSLGTNAGVAGVVTIAQMANALEALLKELHEKPKNINASTLRTVAAAIDFLHTLFRHTQTTELTHLCNSQILVVDDEVISRRAISHALEKADLRAVTVAEPQVALKLLEENAFDLVFLDVDMPGMTGFELCTKLRSLALHKKTPVVFVTGLNDFESRANSTISGGNDLIAKPFLVIELAVKALVYVMRTRLDSRSRTQAPPVETPAAALALH